MVDHHLQYNVALSLKICVTEGDFPLGINRIIDSIDDVVPIFIA